MKFSVCWGKGIFGLIILISLLEVILRWANFPASWTSIYQFDDELGYRLASGIHNVSISGTTKTFFVDADGIIDRYGDGNPDILILGDGVIAGIEQVRHKRLAYLVGRCTGKTVVNLSVPGYGTVQQLIGLIRWLQRSVPPKHVVLVYNTTNDYFDNVKQWEGNRIPGIARSADHYRIVTPDNPNVMGRAIREIFWHSRLLELLRLKRSGNLMRIPSFPEEQKWFFATASRPEQSKLGDEATRLAFDAFVKLQKKYNFDFKVLFWRDTLAEKEEGLKIDDAISRLKKLTDGILNDNNFIYFDRIEDEKEWEEMYLSTRHASDKAIDYISLQIANEVGQECH
jgi:hypothetical protein